MRCAGGGGGGGRGAERRKEQKTNFDMPANVINHFLRARRCARVKFTRVYSTLLVVSPTATALRRGAHFSRKRRIDPQFTHDGGVNRRNPQRSQSAVDKKPNLPSLSHLTRSSTPDYVIGVCRSCRIAMFEFLLPWNIIIVKLKLQFVKITRNGEREDTETHTERE